MIQFHSCFKKFLFFVLLLRLADAMAADRFVSFLPSTDTWQLKNISISINQYEHSCVRLAANNLLADIEKVTGQKGLIVDEGAELVIGTVGVNKQIDQWVKNGELCNLKGKTEKYVIKTIGKQLVIAGSDKRGTVYGIYELSRQIGVSPWYYWADVPIEKHSNIYIYIKVSIPMVSQRSVIVDYFLTMRRLVLLLG